MKEKSIRIGRRANLKDIWWNAFMVKNCTEWENDIPVCPTKKIDVPSSLVAYKEAMTIYNKEMKKDKNFKNKSYVCFYLDDERFDNIGGIWFKPQKALNILKHFGGIVTPDFSTYDDFPYSLKVWNTYRMRAFGFWCSCNGVNVINNVRWSYDTRNICFCGIPKESIVCLGTVASGLKYSRNRKSYEYHLLRMVQVLKPKIILVYGGAKYSFFSSLRKSGFIVISYPSARNRKKQIVYDASLYETRRH